MTKTDFKKTLDSYQAESGQFRILEVPPMQYVMVNGHGDPNSSQEFTNALEALYPVAYKLKFASKRDLDRDYVVMPLEGLWWSEDMASFTVDRDKSRWDWTVMSMVPDWITREMFDAAVAKVAAKNPPTSLDRVRLETLEEGRRNGADVRVPGVSTLVCLLNNGDRGVTETQQSLLGPFWRMHSPKTKGRQR